MKTCLHRFLGEGKDCRPNYNPQNHPNNHDYLRYYEINYQTIEVTEEDGTMTELDLIGKLLDQL